MVNYETLTLGAYRTNCYLLRDEKTRRCAVVDPGYEPETILRALDAAGLTLGMILLTHGHFDHVGAVRDLAAEADVPIRICEKETALPPQLTAGPLLYTAPYADGDVFAMDSLTFRVLETPGHTPGSVCLLCGDLMLSGDTLFAGACGRTDLPGGSTEEMLASLRRLGALEGDYTVLPGHGAPTTLSEERRTNWYLRAAR